MLAAAPIGVRGRVCNVPPSERVTAHLPRIRLESPTYGVKSADLFPTFDGVRHKDTSPALPCLVRAIAQDAAHRPRGFQSDNQRKR